MLTYNSSDSNPGFLRSIWSGKDVLPVRKSLLEKGAMKLRSDVKSENRTINVQYRCAKKIQFNSINSDTNGDTEKKGFHAVKKTMVW